MRRSTLTALLCLFSPLGLSIAAAEDLGVVGKTYAIAETDLLTVIQRQLQAMAADGRLEKAEQDLKARAEAYVNRPSGRHLPRAIEPRVYYHDPSVTTAHDLIDHRGQIIHPAGTTINPLDYVSLTTPLVFFDGDDETQARWVRALIERTPDRYVVLMTNGPVIERMQAWQIRLYFDQHGRYTERLGIRALPAVVRQEGARLRIDEIVLEASR